MVFCYNSNMHYFYLFRCKDGSLYSGYTTDIKRREALHNSGKGAAYTRSRGGGSMVYFEKFRTPGRALRREAEVKKWPREKKLALIKR